LRALPTTSLSQNLTLDQEKLPRNRKNIVRGREVVLANPQGYQGVNAL